MCGIAGILDPAGVDAAQVQRMADTLAHRGPDDATVHIEPGLGFGFRRLAIIDLVTGRQPIPNEDESVWVMLNGEIYNYRELRRGLERRRHRFRTRSDTEVLVHLYEEKGAALVDELRGMFAFAIWDRRRRSLLLARDHLGQKPLYWARRGSRFYFASEIKAILAVAPEFRRLDPLGLHEYLTLRVIYEPRSMFEGVHKLAAATVLETGEEGDVVTRRYWSLRYEPKREISEAEALEQLDEWVRETVRLHLVADVEVGAFLSGGVDSGLVAAIVGSITEGSFQTFTVGTPYGRFDETPAARTVARRYRTDHHETAVGGELLALLPTLVYHLDEPSDPLSACTYRLAELTRSSVKVAVGGDGGDELFGGYDRYYGARYANYYALLPEAIRERIVGKILDWAPDGFWYKSLSHQLRWLNELARVKRERRYARSLSYFYFTPGFRDELYTEQFKSLTSEFDAEASVMLWQRDAGAKEALDSMLLADSIIRLPNHSVMILDRMTMAHGLEARSPFLDHKLAEFAATLPVHLKVRGRSRRWIEMRLAERYLPEEVLRRPKQGFSSALPYMMGDQFRSLFHRYLPDSHLVEGGLLHGAAIQSLLDEHMCGRRDHGNRLWLLLNAEVWYRLHVEGIRPEALLGEVREALAAERAIVAGGTALEEYPVESTAKAQ
ncbi:MAG: asparagine synthase (glutamine-hydrolyzing) [Gemmatimonadota bacterium]